MPLITLPTMNCGKLVAENCKIAPMAEIEAPVRRVFFLPRRSPNKAAKRHPARFPSGMDVSVRLPRVGSCTHRKAAGGNSLDVGVSSLRECLDKV
jgi:hypothetical protein